MREICVSHGVEIKETRRTYTSADAAVAFLDVLMAFTKWTLGLQCDCCVAAMAGPGIGLRVFNFCSRLGSCQCRTRNKGWYCGFTIVGVGFEGPEVDVS